MNTEHQAQRYHQTPTVQIFDNGGRTVSNIHFNRGVNNELQTLIIAHRYNCLEQLVSLVDPRLFDLQVKTASVQATYQQISSLNDKILFTHHVDNGLRLQLFHAQGPLLWSRDTRKTEHYWNYDSLARPIANWGHIENKQAQCLERFYYGDDLSLISSENATRANLKGQRYQHEDTAGCKQFLAYDINQHSIAEAQQFLKNNEPSLHWSEDSVLNASLLEDDIYSHYACFTALGNIDTQINSKEYQQTFEYNLLGQLKKAFLNLPHDVKQQPLLLDCKYHASGQLLQENLANGIKIQREYEPYFTFNSI